jgi:hypothetical protein
VFYQDGTIQECAVPYIDLCQNMSKHGTSNLFSLLEACRHSFNRFIIQCVNGASNEARRMFFTKMEPLMGVPYHILTYAKTCQNMGHIAISVYCGPAGTVSMDSSFNVSMGHKWKLEECFLPRWNHSGVCGTIY